MENDKDMEINKNKGTLSIWYTNADTLTKDKLLELENEIHESNGPPYIIAITEIKPN